MKKLIALLGAALAFTVAAPVEAQAGHRDYGHGHGCSHQRQVGKCGHCGRPVMAQKQFVGYDCKGCPVYRWVTLRHTHCEHAAYMERQRRARSCDSHSRHHYDHHRGNGGRGHTSFRPPTPHDIIGRIFGRR